jgi:hypothetical protein
MKYSIRDLLTITCLAAFAIAYITERSATFSLREQLSEYQKQIEHYEELQRELVSSLNVAIKMIDAQSHTDRTKNLSEK